MKLNKHFLTTTQAAKAAGMPSDTLRTWLKRNVIPSTLYVKTTPGKGGWVQFKPDSIDTLKRAYQLVVRIGNPFDAMQNLESIEKLPLIKTQQPPFHLGCL